MKLSSRETATMLAALRYWQMDVLEIEGARKGEGHFETEEPLSAEDVDELCERINYKEPDNPNLDVSTMKMALEKLREAESMIGTPTTEMFMDTVDPTHRRKWLRSLRQLLTRNGIKPENLAGPWRT